MSLGQIYVSLARGEFGRARTECETRLAADASNAAIHHALGMTFCAEGLLPQALPHLHRAADLDPETVRWARDAGAVCAALGHWMECVDRLTPVIPWLDATGLMVYLLAGVETHRSAFVLEQVEGRADWQAPTDLDARCGYASALTAAGRFAEAEPLLLECMAQAPRMWLVQDALADLCDRTGREEQALHHRRERVRLDPHCARARLRLAISLAHRGWFDEARVERLQAHRLGLTRPQEHSSMMFMMLSDEYETAASLLTAARQGFASYDNASGAPLPRRSTARSGRLRIGYVSAETRGTPSYHFFRPFLENHDRSAVEVTLFNCSPIRDLFTLEYQQWPEHWRDVANIPTSQVAAQLRREEFDVLVDLSGFFPFNGLHVLAERVAPVQINYPNYPGTTGSPCVDYALTDVWTSPPGTEGEYSERLHYIPTGYLGFDVSSANVDVGPLPCVANRRPTFGVFQRLSKFTSAVWDALAGVLAAVPDAHLHLVAGDEELARPESQTTRAVMRELEGRGVDVRRVSCLPPRTRRDQLLALTGVDVALDTFPYNGQTTTCEALWMGVPVVTLFGQSHVGRVSGGLVARAGHADWIAHSTAQYCEIAATLVSDIGRLARTRRQLRADFMECGLADGRRLARELETAYATLA